VRWCPACAADVLGRPRRAETHAGRLDRLDGVAPLPTWAATAYVAGVRDVVVAWKDRGRVDLDPLLAAAVGRVAREVAPVLRDAVGPDAVAVVPVPSTLAARRRRGRDPVGVLAAAVATGLVAAGLRADVAPLLRRRGAARDQVGLGARARGRNLDDAVSVRRRPSSAACLLVDDVLTTGATLAAAERALERVGAAVLGAVVLAATPPPGAVTRSSQPVSSQRFTARTPSG
jgi:predicted amidophosphoribosyltransferase